MTTETRFTFAGLESAHIGHRNSSGAFNGFSNLTSSNTNTDSGMRQLKYVQSIPNPTPARVLVRSKGDDGEHRGFQFPGAVQEVEARFGMNDLIANADMLGATNYDLGNWRLGIEGPTLPTLSDMMLLTIAQAGAEDSGSTGSGFKMRLYPNVQFVPLGEAEQNYQGEGIFRYNIIINPFTVLPWAAAFSSSNFTVSDGLSISWFSTYRTMLHAYVGNGASTTLTLDYTPISTAYTKAFNADSAGAALTVSSVNTGAKTATLSAAPASGVLTTAIYGFARYS